MKAGGLARATTAARPRSLDLAAIDKYVTRLVIPPAMPRTAGLQKNSIDYYVIGVRQFRQQILPPGNPMTTVWSYGSQSKRGTLNYPAFTIEAKVDRRVRVKWINNLVDGNGDFLPHLLPVDPTLHWANSPGGIEGRDSHPEFTSTPGPYGGPVPIVTHLHGGHSNEESDGFAEAWYLPDAGNIPSGFASVGTYYDPFKAKFADATGEVWDEGTAVFQYGNDPTADPAASRIARTPESTRAARRPRVWVPLKCLHERSSLDRAADPLTLPQSSNPPPHETVSTTASPPRPVCPAFST